MIFGGVSQVPQTQALQRGTDILVATPGRLLDLMNQGFINLKDIEIFVLDEADRMLDMGFGIQIDRILKHLPAKKQTLMFSATFSPEILKLSKKYLQDPERITVGSINKITPKIKQDIKHTNTATKYADLSSELDAREGSIIVFVNTKIIADLCPF